MCLDPRPDSLVRVRPSSLRPAARLSSARSTRATRRPSSAPPRVDATPWAAPLTDDLDLRGWTLVTLATATGAAAFD
jgi:hypothetical protein